MPNELRGCTRFDVLWEAVCKRIVLEEDKTEKSIEVIAADTVG